MNTTSIKIKAITAVPGEARGHVSDLGEPRLVIDCEDGERVYATFGRLANHVPGDPADMAHETVAEAA